MQTHTQNQTPPPTHEQTQKQVQTVMIQAAQRVVHALEERPSAWLVGVAGLPGSGKSTLCAQLLKLLPGTVVVPMDGYHIPRCRLDEEGMRRRGSMPTFDAQVFREDIQRLRHERCGLFPEFNHADQDPRPDAIEVLPSTPVVIVEGLYVLMREWGLEELFDLRVFVDCDLETALERVAGRHYACGLCATLEQARDRAHTNDLVNAQTIQNDQCQQRAHITIKT